VPRDVGQRLCGDAVASDLDRGRERPEVRVDGHLDGEARAGEPCCLLSDGGGEAKIEHRRTETIDKVPHFGGRGVDVVDRSVE